MTNIEMFKKLRDKLSYAIYNMEAGVQPTLEELLLLKGIWKAERDGVIQVETNRDGAGEL